MAEDGPEQGAAPAASWTPLYVAAGVAAAGAVIPFLTGQPEAEQAEV